MLRIGKNKDQEENEHTSQKPEVPDYAPKSYPVVSDNECRGKAGCRARRTPRRDD